MHPASLHRVIGLQLFNTHGTEIAPGSNVVGEDLYFDFVQDKLPLVAMGPGIYYLFTRTNYFTHTGSLGEYDIYSSVVSSLVFNLSHANCTDLTGGADVGTATGL